MQSVTSASVVSRAQLSQDSFGIADLGFRPRLFINAPPELRSSLPTASPRKTDRAPTDNTNSPCHILETHLVVKGGGSKAAAVAGQ